MFLENSHESKILTTIVFCIGTAETLTFETNTLFLDDDDADDSAGMDFDEQVKGDHETIQSIQKPMFCFFVCD